MDTAKPAGSGLFVLLRWTARVWGTGLFLLWGAFFVQHLEWFANPHHLPPLWVVMLMGFHLAMLIGFLAAWRWEVLGGCVVLVSSLVFFSATAGTNAAWFLLLNSVPAILWLLCGCQTLRTSRTRIRTQRPVR
jgi:hypothetical protein